MKINFDQNDHDHRDLPCPRKKLKKVAQTFENRNGHVVPLHRIRERCARCACVARARQVVRAGKASTSPRRNTRERVPAMRRRADFESFQNTLSTSGRCQRDAGGDLLLSAVRTDVDEIPEGVAVDDLEGDEVDFLLVMSPPKIKVCITAAICVALDTLAHHQVFP